MMRIEDIITDILQREGGGAVTNDPADGGGRTQYGISERANPSAWADGKVTEAEARAIYYMKYVIAPGYDRIIDTRLQAQMIDFGVNSGPFIATQKLQEILHVPADGVIGPGTLCALGTVYSDQTNNALVVARVKMFCRIVQKTPSQLKYLFGWCDRALSFLV